MSGLTRSAITASAAALLIFGSAIGAGAAVRSSGHKSTTTTKPKKLSKYEGIGVTHVLENRNKKYEAVKLVDVIDPARGADRFTSPEPGKHFVAVEIQITGESSGHDGGDANRYMSVVGSNNQLYSAVSDPVTECSNFDRGRYTVTKGETETGCVTFEVPNGIHLGYMGFDYIHALNETVLPVTAQDFGAAGPYFGLKYTGNI